MERNRRIGKAYARVPIVTIDGSHELSYDGYKLALNGFENPDRDAKTEECRKRIGKGIRIKMDHFGNILIKRLSKSGVYVKEWLQAQHQQQQQLSNSSTNGRTSSSQNIMPTRQQLIKNQMLAAAGVVGGNSRTGGLMGSSQISSLGTSITPSSSSSGSSMDPPNDSAICDEVISVGGRLELDKIYVMFDMKKFQANITQELCRAYPDKRKLEQQCFSIVGLARDAEDILSLPCWVMVINIVAIEMLNERFPSLQAGFPDTMLMDSTSGRRSNQPNFVSIFEQNNNNNNNHHLRGRSSTSSKDDNSNKEEDPYSLPANASSSDVKSSINDYSTTSTKNMSSAFLDRSNGMVQHRDNQRSYYGASRRAEMYAHKKELSSRNGGSNVDNNSQIVLHDNMKHRSKSNCNIYGAPVSNQASQRDRYNNSSSIYSPGHMLVPPADHPPKLPPRDFVKKTKSKSSSNVNYDEMTRKVNNDNPNEEDIYSTGLVQSGDAAGGAASALESNIGGKVRKTKKNRFLESLKAPLELAKSSAASNRSASVLGAPIGSGAANTESNNNGIKEDSNNKSKSSSKTKGFTKSGAKNLKSFLGVSKSAKSNNKDTISDDSNYVHVDGSVLKSRSKSGSNDNSVEVDSVVDSNEEIDDSQQVATNSSSSASYNDLDIPTPDYETDENIYAIEDVDYNTRTVGGGFSTSENKNGRRTSSNSTNGKKASSKAHQKEDLYYSGFLAHVPQNSYAASHANGNMRSASSIGLGKLANKQLIDGSHFVDNNNAKTMSSSSCNTRESSRFVMHKNARMLNASKLSGRDMIYGSTTGLPSMAGTRYRSASMQRYYPRSGSGQQQHLQQQHQAHQYHQVDVNGKSEMYNPNDLESENPYAISGSQADVQGHYGVTGVTGAGHRRRSASKVGAAAGILPFAGGNINRVASHIANSNYDIGRSSSGIYGNNSSSSSSDYTDWHPQMRKVNSSGYLNSIFKSHLSSPVDPFNHQSNALKNNNNNITMASNRTNASYVGNNNSKQLLQQQQQQQPRNGTSRTLKTSSRQSTTSASLSKQQQQKQVASSVVNGPTYRSYDSSNGEFQFESFLCSL